LARLRAYEDEVCDVRARDEQQEADRAHQQPQRFAEIAHDHFFEPSQLRAKA
jgi:hypothetical protein